MSQNFLAPSISQPFVIVNPRAPPQTVAVNGGQLFQAQFSGGQNVTASGGQHFLLGQQQQPHPAPLQLTTILTPAQGPSVDQRMMVMAGQAQVLQVPPNTPTTAMSFQGYQTANPAPAAIPKTPAGVPVPLSYIAALQRSNVGVNCVWKPGALQHLGEFEAEVMHVAVDKERAFWRVWVDLIGPEAEARGGLGGGTMGVVAKGEDEEVRKEKVMRFLARRLREYSWYRGDETVREAMNVLHKIDELYLVFMARKVARAASSSFGVDRMPQGVSGRMGAEAETRTQTQVEEVGDEE